MECVDVTTKFGAADYAVFASVLLLSAGIGVFWAIKDRKKSAGIQGYLMAGRQMNFWPSGISLALTLLTSVTIIGVPVEIYAFGIGYLWLIGIIFWVYPIILGIYMPFFYKRKITSTFEYLGSRFNNKLRLATTGVYIIQNIMFMGIMIYAPALALSAVTGFNLWAAIFVIGTVCTFYTTIGGLKAVIWTDVLQGLVVLAAILVVFFMGTAKAGGFERVWEISKNGSRLDILRFEMDPRYRTTFWSMTFALGTSWISSYGVNQAQGTFRCFLVAFVLGFLMFMIIAFHGLIAYAYFAECDPVTFGALTHNECGVGDTAQILPYMVMLMFGDTPGIPGLYVAGVFAGCLSTVSSGINAMALVSIRDFIQPFVNWEEKTLTLLSKVLVFSFGFLSIGFACLSTALGNILQLALTVQGLIGGPTLGVFVLGMMLPYPNSIGTGCGLVVGLLLGFWMYIGSTTITVDPKFTQIKSFSSRSCDISNTTELFETTTVFPSHSTSVIMNATANTTLLEVSPLHAYYSVSYAYYAAVGCLGTIVSGLLISIITRHLNIDNVVVPQHLLWTKFDRHTWRFFPKSVRCFLWCDGEIEDEEVEEKTHEKTYSPHNNAIVVSLHKNASTESRHFADTEQGKINMAYENENSKNTIL